MALELTSALPPRRMLFSVIMTWVAFALSFIALLPLFSILVTILMEGLPTLTWSVFTHIPAPVGMEGVPDGFANAILGTITMVAIASAISIPIGLFTAIFLCEFSQGSAIANVTRFIVQVLSGVPSIVVGVFAYALIVLNTGGFSAIAGSFALAFVMLPIIVLTTEEALKLVPVNQRLASSGLGATRFQTTFRVVVMGALPAITTGVLLAVARASGETAPLVFTALFSQNWAQGLKEPTASLSVLIYNYASSPFVQQNKMAWTASVVLVVLVLIASVLSRLATRRRLNLR
ncbi:phosphate ABC transporter permease [Neosynechococcus sphagnicola sy1]|uniref:Phosphate transport system permease protein PstA n=1 Tax=Neosynechococcus sphagnicola sy1 TaxID=1497020 RepID=A0A098TMV0_9CYAN|nr:phosphate ABC transporter permease [Neosynechococcus sphagnicola sy1]